MGIKNAKFGVPYVASLILLFYSVIAVAEDVAAVDDYDQFKQAVTLSQQGHWAQAAEMFSAIAQRNPDWPEPKNNLAVAQLNMGQIEQARLALEAAVTSMPSFKIAQHNRQRLYDHLAAQAYASALGNNEKKQLPKLDLLTEIKRVQKVEPEPLIVEKIIEVPVVSEVRNQRIDAIKQQLERWSRFWSQADVDGYLSVYSSRFKPSDGINDYNQWRNMRRVRLRSSANTLIRLEDIHIYLDADDSLALAEFTQHYRSSRYQDKVLKQLQLVLQDGQWLILAERVIQKLD